MLLLWRYRIDEGGHLVLTNSHLNQYFPGLSEIFDEACPPSCSAQVSFAYDIITQGFSATSTTTSERVLSYVVII
jgi:hypothetical protein